MGHTQVFQQARQTQVSHSVAIATGAVGERTGQPCLAYPGGATDDQVQAFTQPLPAAQCQEQFLVQAPWCAVVNIFNTGIMAEARHAQTRRQLLAIALADFAINQKAKTFLEGEAVNIAGLVLFLQCLQHAVQAQGLDSSGANPLGGADISIAVPAGDPNFPDGTSIALTRATTDPTTGTAVNTIAGQGSNFPIYWNFTQNYVDVTGSGALGLQIIGLSINSLGVTYAAGPPITANFTGGASVIVVRV